MAVRDQSLDPTVTSAAQAAPRARTRFLRGTRRNQQWLTLSVVIPAILFYVIFRYYPVVQTMFLSLTDAQLVNPNVHFVGGQNFVNLFNNATFRAALWNTTYYAFATTICTTIIGLALAFLFEPIERGSGLLRVIYFLPQVTSVIAIATIWLWLYQPRFGLFNQVLAFFGIPPISWLTSKAWSMPSLIIMSVWAGVGFSMLIFVAGLKGIPTEFSEAGVIDGASSWQLIWHIKLPLLQRVTTFVFVTGIIGSFQVFQQVYLMTHGGPLDSTVVIALLVYNTAFQDLRFGLASATALILFVIVGLLTILQLRMQKSDWEF